MQDERKGATGGTSQRDGNPICPRRAFLACLALHAPRSVALADFFSILLVVRLEARRGLVEDCGGGAGEGFVAGMVEGIDAELDQAGGQQVEEFLQSVG